MWVSPFRDLRLFGYLLLPVAFRSLSRLSSALSAKASTLRSYSLNLVSIALDTLGRVHLSMLVFTSSFFDQKPSLLTPRMSFLFSMNSSGFPSLVHGFDLRFCIRFSRYFSDKPFSASAETMRSASLGTRNLRFLVHGYFTNIRFVLLKPAPLCKHSRRFKQPSGCLLNYLRGDGEIRTLDPLLARQVLSQLSYTPINLGIHLLSHTVSSAVPSAA